MPPKVRRLARKIGAVPAVTFAGRLEPATAKGFLARRLARGELAGDFRDWKLIREWARDVSAVISSIQVRSPDGPPEATLR